jgi:tetratricopeptide (TPR) repeat protein
MKTTKTPVAGFCFLIAIAALFFSLPPVSAQTQPKGPMPRSASSEGDPKAAPGDLEIPDWKARWELARLLSYLKRYEESLAEYEKVLKTKPDLQDARVEMALVHAWSGHMDRALEIFRTIPPEEMDDRAKLAMADAYAAGKMYDRAETLYRAYMKRHPEDLGVRLKLAELLSWTKRYEESLHLYKTLLEERPDDLQIRRKYAFVLSWAGRHEEAVRELKKTLD